MESIIKKAIEGGYKFDNPYIQNTDPKWIAEHYDYGVKAMICDPLFWQALGKVGGWNKYNLETESAEYLYWRDGAAAKFYEINLTEGWDAAVAYLSSLINQ